MKILVVNDDGIRAPGLALLAQKASELGEVWVVAPARQCSAMSHKVSIFGTLRVERIEDFPAPVKGAYAVEGTPADCVKVAMQYILQEKPDWVFSGINDGCNVGYEIAYSGTLAAAFEARMYDVPAMAFSSAYKVPMVLAEQYLVPVAKELMAETLERGVVWNVNFPDGEKQICKGILRERKVAPVWLYSSSYHEKEMDNSSVILKLGGDPLSETDWIPEGTDMEAVLKGYISVGTVKGVVF